MGNNPLRLQACHDDMQGIISNATGASALGTITIRDTGFPIPAFQNGNDDIIYFRYQFSHRKKLGTNLDSVHIHYYLPSAPSAGNTLLFDVEYTWINDGDTIPATASWTKITNITKTFTGSEAAFSTGIFSLITNIAPPANESYSSEFLIKITRNSTGGGSDTYNDDLGMRSIDIHYVLDRNGSSLEYTD